MDLDELIAREAVRDLVARYNATADTGRFDETVALFAPDALLQVGERPYRGRQEIRALFQGVKEAAAAHAGASPVVLRHCTSTLQIDVSSADAARSRCYYFVLMAHGLDHWGRYVDEFERIEGRWLFSARRESLDGYAEGGFVGSQFELP